MIRKGGEQGEPPGEPPGGVAAIPILARGSLSVGADEHARAAGDRRDQLERALRTVIGEDRLAAAESRPPLRMK
jgi:hypothetical protein